MSTPSLSSGDWADGPLCAFDLETTGADPATARIVTATVIHIRPGQAPAATNWLSDVDGEPIPDEAARIHGITTGHAREHGRPIADVIDEIRMALELAWAAGIPVVGHNVSYDLTLLAAECARIGMATAFVVAGPVLDTITLDRGVDRYRKGPRKLIDTARHYGVQLTETEAHGSEADALAAARIVWHIAHRYPVVGRMSLAELQVWQRDAHHAWAEGLGAYLVRQGKPDDVEREWPIRNPTAQAQAVAR